MVTQINRAQSLGIRVSFGFLNPSSAGSSQDPSILSAILSSGGIYTTISDSTAQANFVSLVLSHGLTDTDHAGGANTLLLPGLLTAGNVSASSGAKTFTYDAVSGENLNFTISSISQQTFDVTLHDKGANKDVGSVSTDASGMATILFDATSATSLDLTVGTKNATAGLFTVNLVSSVNRTITICGFGNTTVPNNSTGTSTTVPIPSSTGTGVSGGSPNGTTIQTPTIPSSPPKYTGGAATLQSFAMGAILPIVVAVGSFAL